MPQGHPDSEGAQALRYWLPGELYRRLFELGGGEANPQMT